MARKKKVDDSEAPAPSAGLAMPPGMQPGMMQPGVMMQPGMMQPGMQGHPGMMQPGMQGHPGLPPGMMMQPGMQGMQPGMMMQPGMQGMPGMAQPGMQGLQPMGVPGYGAPMAMNPMALMLQMMQGMAGMSPPAMGVDPSAQPFRAGVPADEAEPGLAADIVKPAMVEDLVKEQRALPVQPVLDRLCLAPDGKAALGGLPLGCTIAFAGPPGKGKTRAMLEGIARAAAAGTKCAYVVAEEGFRDPENPGRDDLCSRFAKLAMAATGLDEDGLREQVLPNVLIILAQYHRGHTWDDFIRRYRHVVEAEGVRFVVVDSLNTLDPTHARTAENLATLKTYNHEHGVTCVTIGQIKDTGEPVGGEALMHTADAVLLIEELSLGSKEMADFWGGKYRDKIAVIRILKSVTTPIHPHPVRVHLDEGGRLAVHPGQPAEYALLEPAGK